jgi:hypothetical protein
MKKNIFKLLLLIFIPAYSAINSDSEFIKKFINDYGFKVRDRYTHEYNSALLEKTAYSLDKLEEDLAQNNLNLSGRLMICGYEEQAFPSYYFRYKNAEINDEASSKVRAGWSIRLHNIFGFLTGYLFKDFNFYAKHWFAENESIIEHINSNKVEIFQKNKEIFQEHSFGPAMEILEPTQYKIIKNFKNKNYKGIFSELINFWDYIYKQEIEVGNNKPASTQDILFSIEYAKHLIRSQLPMLKWYVGPDITYPIEISSAQRKDATLHAQKFVKTFAKKIKPVNEKPTVFIFCSFVDGVGKSTLLGNIKNYFKYGKNVESYDRVDNSSSQLAEVFKLKENIFIADLPAQVSHFTYKPDGYVYVSTQREFSDSENLELQQFVTNNSKHLDLEYQKNINKVQSIINTNGYFDELINSKENPELVFLKNLILTKKLKNNYWLPFTKDKKHYLFNKSNHTDIRVLIPLKIVQSEGLKNIEAEQMLFLKGVRLPLPYNYFMTNLINKLKDNNVENVVFVDFISMYPRSSRENVRINYLMQQLNLLDNSFNSELSLYKNFINDAELLNLLNNKKSLLKTFDSFKLEVLTRLSLFKMITKRNISSIKGVSINEITKQIKNEIKNLSQDNLKLLETLTKEKIAIETKKLEKTFGKTKSYINVQKTSFEHMLFFSQLLSDFFTNHFANKNLNILWQYPKTIINENENTKNGHINKLLKTANNEEILCHYCFAPEFREEHILAPFLKMMRSCWYASITNLFFSQPISSQTFDSKEKIPYNINPLFLNMGTDNKIYLTQKIFEEWADDLPKNRNGQMHNIFHLKTNEKSDWVNIKDQAYRNNWKAKDTDYGLYTFDSNLSNIKEMKKTACTFIIQKYQEEKGADKVITASKLYKKLKESYVWQREQKKQLKDAIENRKEKKDDKQGHQKTEYQEKNSGIKLGTPEQKSALQMITRLIVTLEMFLKDPNSDIAIRPYNKKDFKAGLKLFEKMTLPQYFGIIYQENLFENYNQVEPYPSWNSWEEIN